MEFLSVTGPLRSLLEGSSLGPYFATPHGDMMLAGAFGLVRAWAEKHEPWRDEINRALLSVQAGPGDEGHHGAQRLTATSPIISLNGPTLTSFPSISSAMSQTSSPAVCYTWSDGVSVTPSNPSFAMLT